MKTLIIFMLFASSSLEIFAQQNKFDFVTYTKPKNWSERENISSISYTKIDGSSWGQIGIYKHRISNGDVKSDFDKDWEELLSTGKNISAVQKTEPKFVQGWFVMSGSGNWQYNGSNVTSILTVYSNQKITIAILCNATSLPYFKEYQTLISTLNIADNSPTPALQEKTRNVNTDVKENQNSIIGLWTDYSLETAGNYINGYPQYTAGYLRKEYAFYKDNTYVFRNKQWITKTKDILYINETGSYTVKGNEITLIPKNGKGEFWQKMASSKDWGKLVKAFDYKLEKVTYVYNIIFDPNYSNSIVLSSAKPTQRDGGAFNAANETYTFRYSFRKLDSLIDNPPIEK